MGAADTVPGVSGGTVALILGHYQRLVTAISRFDRELVLKIGQREFEAAAKHIDLRFLGALGVGIAAGIVSLAGIMHWLLDHRMPETFAVFLGLLMASVWIVHRSIDRWRTAEWITMLTGAVVAVLVSNLPSAVGSSHLGYLFLAGSVAICAMILPGISGAFVLLLFGVYHQITGIIKDAAKGNVNAGTAAEMVVFAAGCLFGLLAFSRLLRWLLEHRHNSTMAGLLGLMIGSVAKLWPLQMPTPETAELEFKFREMTYVAPDQWPGSLTLLITLVLAAATIVLVVERIARGGETAADAGE